MKLVKNVHYYVEFDRGLWSVICNINNGSLVYEHTAFPDERQAVALAEKLNDDRQK